MTDVLSKQQRSFCMSRIKRTNTKPELALRKALFLMGARFRVKNELPGKPDVVFIKSRIAVFVDGCFWHSCPEHSNLPKNNRTFWKAKLSGNQKRDEEVNHRLKTMGWRVVRIWEHEIKVDPFEAARKVLMTLKSESPSELQQPLH